MTHIDAMSLVDAAKQALLALESSRIFVTTREKIKHPEGTEWYDEHIDALYLAIEQAERQEPHYLHCICGAGWEISADGGEELVDAPPQRQPLTEGEIELIALVVSNNNDPAPISAFARAIERKHGIGGEHD